MHKIFIKSINKEIEIKEKTRGMTRQIEATLFDGVDVGLDGFGGDFKIPTNNMLKSQELEIKLRFGLNDDEINNLTDKEYLELVETIRKEEKEVKKN